jgi:Ca-activated chloride channel homolog
MNPIGLLGLLTIPIILILHMFQKRQKQYTVSSLRLWSFLTPQVHGSKARHIPITPLLILDLLIAAMITITLTLPHLKIPLIRQADRQLVVLLDVSSSMLTNEGVESRIDMARHDVLGKIGSLSSKDQAIFITYGTKTRIIGDTRYHDIEEIVTVIKNIQAGETGNNLSEAVAVGQSIVDPKRRVSFHIFTDAAYPDPEIQALPYPIDVHRYGNNVANQAVISISAEPLGIDFLRLFARVANFSESTASRKISVSIDSIPVIETEIDLPANSIVPMMWQLPNGKSSASVALFGSDDLNRDNQAFIGLSDSRTYNVQIVSEDAKVLERVFGSIPGVTYSLTKPSDYQAGATMDLTIFQGYRPTNWPAGTTLLLPPYNNNSSAQINLPMIAPAQIIDPDSAIQMNEDPAIDGIDFTGVDWGNIYIMDEIPANFTALIENKYGSFQMAPFADTRPA